MTLDNNLKTQVNDLFNESFDKKQLTKTFQLLLKNKPEHSIHLTDLQKQKKIDSKEIYAWKPLFLAKHLRARIMENGTDDYTERLDDLLIYLQRNLPSECDNVRLLQHIYFQELSACGKPGLESLGFAVRAYDVLDSKDVEPEKGNHFSFELYKLWANLNQGIGYSHSNQKMEAAHAFDEIIRRFKHCEKSLQPNERDLWQSLIYDQAILLKAEVHEYLQFSYHTLKTLCKLGNGRKKERRLIKEALAYRDMGRLEKTEEVIAILWGTDRFPDKVKQVFQRYEVWKSDGNTKKGTAAQCIGTLIDYYLEKFQKNTPKITENDINDFTNRLITFFRSYPELKKIRGEKMGFYQQVARHLKWLTSSDHGDKHKEIAESLYLTYRNDFKRLEIKDFNSYEYDRYTESLESFFKEMKGQNYKDDEIYFTNKVRDFEKDKNILFQFKEAEREHRNVILSWNEDSNRLECGSCLKDNYQTESIKELLSGCIRRGTCKNNNSTKLSTFDYEMIIQRQKVAFLKQIESRSLHKKQRLSINFIGLQRWNSSTPALALSLGGGYFIYKTDQKGKVELGIAIDPGFNFLENLFAMGFTLSDIDFVLISHGHADHIRDFEPIVDLLHYIRKNKRKSDLPDKKIHVILTLGVYDRLKNVIADTTYREYLSDTYIVDIDKEINDHIKNGEHGSLPKFKFLKENNCQYVAVLNENESPTVVIQPTWAYHYDSTNVSDSFGFIIQFGDNQFKFGYTGDTKWKQDAYQQYVDCDALLIHLGSLIDRDKKFNYYDAPEKCRQLISEKGHLYIFGLLHYMTQLAESFCLPKRKLILLSEFGEELKGGIRIDLTDRLNDLYCKKLIFLPVDVGLNVRLIQTENTSEKIGVLCTGCDNFVDPDEIRYRHYGHGHDEALFYFCNTCLKARPENVIQDKMHSICDFGIPLQKPDESD